MSLFNILTVSDGYIYVASDNNKVYRVINNTIDDKFESFTLPSNLQDADAILFDHTSRRLVVFKGKYYLLIILV